MAIHLLFQITAFLRETFQSLPRSRIHKGTVLQSSMGGGAGGVANWDKLASHRRWSILSNTFSPTAAAAAASGVVGGGGGPASAVSGGSIHSINDLHPCERRVSYSTADEADQQQMQYGGGNAVMGSPRGSRGGEEQGVDAGQMTAIQQQQAQQVVTGDKKGRTRLAQGRQRLVDRKRGSPTATQAPAQLELESSAVKKRESIRWVGEGNLNF